MGLQKYLVLLVAREEGWRMAAVVLWWWSGGLGSGRIPFLAKPAGRRRCFMESGGKELTPAEAVRLQCLLCVKGVEEQLCCCPAHSQHSALP